MGAYIWKLHKVIDTNIGKVGIMKYWYKPGGVFGSEPRGADSTLERLKDKYDGGVEFFMYGDKISECIGEGVLRHDYQRKSVAVNDCSEVVTVGKLLKVAGKRGQYVVRKDDPVDGYDGEATKMGFSGQGL